MTGSERVLARLRRGPATAAELYAETRCMVHSRVSNLRERGYVIECDKRNNYTYRLLSEPDIPRSEDTARAGGHDAVAFPASGLVEESSPGSLSEGTLFSLSRGAYEGEAA